MNVNSLKMSKCEIFELIESISSISYCACCCYSLPPPRSLRSEPPSSHWLWTDSWQKECICDQVWPHDKLERSELPEHESKCYRRWEARESWWRHRDLEQSNKPPDAAPWGLSSSRSPPASARNSARIRCRSRQRRLFGLRRRGWTTSSRPPTYLAKIKPGCLGSDRCKRERI